MAKAATFPGRIIKMSPMVKIRKATESDIDQLELLFLVTRREAFDWKKPDQFKREDYKKATEGETIFVAEDGNVIVGFVSVWEHDSIPFIHHLFVAQDHQNKGIGWLLIKSLFPLLPLPYRLKCVAQNKKALRFYQKTGWIEIGQGVGEDGDYFLLELTAAARDGKENKQKAHFFSSGHVTVPDGELYFESTGVGEPLIFLHAGFSDRRDWKHQVKDLEKEFNTIVYDQRGAGNSSVPTASFSPGDDLRAIMDHLKIAKATVIGHSLGGTIALDFALQYPEKVSSLILVAPGLNGHVWSNEYSEWFKTIWSLSKPTDMLQQTMSAPFYVLAVTNPNIKSEIEEIIKENIEKMLTWKSLDIQWFFPEPISKLKELEIPTLVIYGDKDSQDIKQIVDALIENLPNVKATKIQNADHLLNFEKPNELNALIFKFLNRS
jgi:pimeloyl-ACP methyl ester carboxylesterase/ribosomal protein S18 acetylase RimI-like enzyme